MRSLAVLLALAAAVPAGAQQTPPADSPRVYELAEVEVLPRPQNAADFMAALRDGYPAHLRAARTEGTVQVAFVVGPDGVPHSARVAESTEAGFDSVTVVAIRVLRFTPAMVAGRPVSVRVVQPVQWRLSPKAAANPCNADLCGTGEGVAEADDGVYELAEVEELPRPVNTEEFVRALAREFPFGRDHPPVGATVQVRFQVGEDGRVSVPRVTHSSDVGFNDPALRVVRALRVRPAKVNGRPVKVWVEQPIIWRVGGGTGVGGGVAMGVDVVADSAAATEPDDGVYELAEVEELPRPLNAPAFQRALAQEYPFGPEHPPVGASVQVRFRVGVDGTISMPQVTRSSDVRFNDATMRAIRMLRFRPAKVNGRPVNAWVEQPIIWTPPPRPAIPPARRRP